MHTVRIEFDVNYRKSSVKRNSTFYFGKETVSIANNSFVERDIRAEKSGVISVL